jgi:hypothetical protein
MVGVCWMVIEFFWLPSNTPPLSDGNQEWEHVICFLKTLVAGFPKTHEMLTFCGDKKISVPTEIVTIKYKHT